MRKLLLTITSIVALAAPQKATAQAQPFVAQVMIFGGNFCPLGWAQLDGSLLPINQNQALFSLLGTTYGGDGKTNFRLPLAKPFVVNDGAVMTQCIALQGIFPSRN
jgi:microcystin-dependent protein